MARIARVVVPGVPHHITQRGNRRQEAFFEPADFREYLSLMKEWCGRSGVEIWAYCLMPNHVHLIAVPEAEDSLRRGIGEAHRRYTRYINFKKGWKGHLWQERFASFPMDEPHLLAAARYVELNPVRARIKRTAKDYKWSSCRAHLAGENDDLVQARPLLDRVPDWSGFLKSGLADEEWQVLRKHETTGRPLGDDGFVSGLEEKLGRVLRPGKRGPKIKNADS